MYQESLARRLQKVQSHSQQEIEEFEEAIRVVKKQIEAQQIREAKLRRRMRVKTEPSTVLSLYFLSSPSPSLPICSLLLIFNPSSLSTRSHIVQSGGVLICGDRIEKIAYTEKLVQKKVTETSQYFQLFCFNFYLEFNLIL